MGKVTDLLTGTEKRNLFEDQRQRHYLTRTYLFMKEHSVCCYFNRNALCHYWNAEKRSDLDCVYCDGNDYESKHFTKNISYDLAEVYAISPSFALYVRVKELPSCKHLTLDGYCLYYDTDVTYNHNCEPMDGATERCDACARCVNRMHYCEHDYKEWTADLEHLVAIRERYFHGYATIR